MTEYVHLIGAEDVRNAANTMASAAERMQQAASSFYDTAMRLERALDEHARRVEEAMKPTPTGASHD